MLVIHCDHWSTVMKGFPTILKLKSKNWRHQYLQLQTDRVWGYVHDIYVGQVSE
jgi:hypothetical protein